MLCVFDKLRLSQYPHTASGLSLSNLHYFASTPKELSHFATAPLFRWQSVLTAHFAILGGGTTVITPECACEVWQGRKACGKGDFRNAHIAFKHFFGFAHTDKVQVVHGCAARGLFEKTAQIAFVKTCNTAQVLKGYGLREVIGNIVKHGHKLLHGLFSVECVGDGKKLLTMQKKRLCW